MLIGLSVVAIAVQCYGLYRPVGPPQPDWLPYADKIAHLLGFAVPVALVLLSVAWFARVPSRPVMIAVVAAFAGQAVLSELVQAYLLPNRAGDLADLVADGLGIGLGVLVGRRLGHQLALSRRHRSGSP